MSRLWLDANVILRFLTKDPPEMAERSARLMAQAERGEVSLYVSLLVVTEGIWVLDLLLSVFHDGHFARHHTPLYLPPGSKSTIGS